MLTEVLRARLPTDEGYVVKWADTCREDIESVHKEALGWPVTSVYTHEVCGGFMDIKVVSVTHCAMYCRSCGYRLKIPRTVKTVRDLGLWLESIAAEREADHA